METLVFDKGHSTYLVNSAHLLERDSTASIVHTTDLAKIVADKTWAINDSNPFIKWIAGDFAEAENPNSNTQYWTAGDLEMAEYTIKYAPLNMVHKFRQPIGFYAATKTVKLEKADNSSSPMKIQALSGLWTHIFPFETAQVEAADDAGQLFYSMECRGTHLTCGTNEEKGLIGCGKTFDYMALDTHCDHLLERSSVRHIVNPTFRGGALIVPPVLPGWKNAHASVVSDSVMQEAAKFAEQNEEQYKVLDAAGIGMTASAWEQLMAQLMMSAADVRT